MRHATVHFTHAIYTKKNGKTARYASRLGRAYLHLKPKARSSQDALHWEAVMQLERQGWKPEANSIDLILTFAWNGRADLIGLAETVLDALEGAAYLDDKQVRNLTLSMKPKGSMFDMPGFKRTCQADITLEEAKAEAKEN